MTQGYIQPSTTNGYPNGLSLEQFIQTVFTGISGIDGTLVRPDWQPNPPAQPDIDVDWMGIGIGDLSPDANSYLSGSDNNVQSSQRHETLDVQCQIYGPNAGKNYGLLRDGFQLDANRSALFQANMGFVEITRGRRVPDLYNQRWYNRIICSVFLTAEILRTYPVLTLVSASGTIYIPDVSLDYSSTWTVPPT